MRLSVGEIAGIVDGDLWGTADSIVRRAIHDSRRVEPGDLFVALRGSRVDGHKFLAEAAARGSGLFDDLGCAGCHVRALPLDSLVFEDPGPLDAAGTLRAGEVAEPAGYDLALLDWAAALPRNAAGQVMVPLFGDLKRHKITDRQVATLGNELLSQRFVERDVFQTAELWGLASTAPYGHRGDLTTLDAVIRAHGGAARQSRDGYVALGEAERGAVVAFLKTLVIAE